MVPSLLSCNPFPFWPSTATNTYCFNAPVWWLSPKPDHFIAWPLVSVHKVLLKIVDISYPPPLPTHLPPTYLDLLSMERYLSKYNVYSSIIRTLNKTWHRKDIGKLLMRWRYCSRKYSYPPYRSFCRFEPPLPLKFQFSLLLSSQRY